MLAVRVMLRVPVSPLAVADIWSTIVETPRVQHDLIRTVVTMVPIDGRARSLMLATVRIS